MLITFERGGWALAMNQEEDVALQQAIDFYDEKK